MDRRRFLLASAAASATATADTFACAPATLMASNGAFAAGSVDDSFADYFAQANAKGTLVLADMRGGNTRILLHDKDRAAQRFTPASTFKIPHSLIALDAGVVRDASQVIPWDGVMRPIDGWNRDQNLRSAMRNSTVWVFSRFANTIGLQKEAAYMRKISYGNALSSGAAPFWVEGDLAISAHEQIAFLQRLYCNALPFSVEHQLVVKDVMIIEAGRDWILRAKTGWSGKIGWWVGWIEWPTGPVFFALNIDTPNRLDDLPKRESIVRQALRSMSPKAL